LPMISGTRIRLEGIDAPETEQICLNSKGQRWTCGIEGRDQLKWYADGKRWICKGDHTDRYGRVLAWCSVHPRSLDRHFAPMEPNLALGAPPAVTAPPFAARMTRSAGLFRILLQHRAKRLDPSGQAKAIEARRTISQPFTNMP